MWSGTIRALIPFVEEAPQIDVLAVALDELETSLQDHVDRAADLVGEAEVAGQLGHVHHLQLERSATLLARAQALRRSVDEQRLLLHEVRSQMFELLRPPT